MSTNDFLKKAFKIIQKYDMKISIYATFAIYYRKVELFFKNKENSENVINTAIHGVDEIQNSDDLSTESGSLLDSSHKKQINPQIDAIDLVRGYFENDQENIFTVSLLSLACKSNDIELSGKIIEKLLAEKGEDNSDSDNSENHLDHTDEDNQEEIEGQNLRTFYKLKKRVYAVESAIPLLFDYELHTPCPFIRIIGLLICLNEQGKLISNNQTSPSQEHVDQLFNISSQNLLKILLDQNILKYSVNELAYASIPKSLELFKDLTMHEKINQLNVQAIREKNNIKIDI